jgi:hypothetical protein
MDEAARVARRNPEPLTEEEIQQREYATKLRETVQAAAMGAPNPHPEINVADMQMLPIHKDALMHQGPYAPGKGKDNAS